MVDGEIRDADALTNALKAFFDEEKLPRKDVRIGLASNRIGVRTSTSSGSTTRRGSTTPSASRRTRCCPSRCTSRCSTTACSRSGRTRTGEPSRRVLLVVAPRDQVEPYVEVAGRAGIKLAGIDLEALGLLRAFVEPKPFAARAGRRHGDRRRVDRARVVHAARRGRRHLRVHARLRLGRRRPRGGHRDLAGRPPGRGGDDPAPPLARPAPAASTSRLDEVARAKAVEAVRLRLTPFARELVSSLQFYQTQADSLGIGDIVITGGTSHLEGLGDALHQMIGVDVSVGDPLARVVRAGEFDPAIEAVIGSMAVPIGLAIDDDRRAASTCCRRTPSRRGAGARA